MTILKVSESMDSIDDVQKLKDDLQVEFNNCSCFGTNVIAVAIAKRRSLNYVLYIPTNSGNSLCNDVYDNVKDCFCIFGTAWHEIGLIPVSCNITMNSVRSWNISVPLPYSILEKYMTSTQRLDFETWKSGFEARAYKIEFFQTQSVY